jgi:hypothetical protein
MSLNQISQRLEIAFWTSWVQMAVNLRSTWLAPVLVLTGACLLALALAGFSAGVLRGAASQAAPVAQVAVVRPHTEQENLLLGWVDELRPGSHLQGLWLVVYSPQENNMSLLPILHAGRATGFDGAFNWSPGAPADAAFLNQVNRKGILWDHYLILERSSLSGLLHLVGELNLNGRFVPPDQALDEMTMPGAPEMVLQRQADILNALCVNWDGAFGSAAPDLMGGLWLNNSAADMSEAHFEQTWQALMEAGSPTCEFPTLQRR